MACDRGGIVVSRVSDSASIGQVEILQCAERRALSRVGVHSLNAYIPVLSYREGERTFADIAAFDAGVKVAVRLIFFVKLASEAQPFRIRRQSKRAGKRAAQNLAGVVVE